MMKRLVASTLLLVVCLLPAAAYAQTSDGDPPAAPAGAVAIPEAYVPGQLVVRVQDGIGDVRAAAGLEGLAVEIVTLADPCIEEGDDGSALQIWRVPEGSEEAVLAQLRAVHGVALAGRDGVVRAASAATPETPYPIDDPLYASHQWSMQRANLARGLQLASTQSMRKVRVAVIDSGVDFAHPDLAGRLLPGKNYIAAGTTPQDDFGHGTHVSGVIAALTNNARGIAGSAPMVEIDPRKVLGSTGTGAVSNLRLSICEAARAGAQVINMSLEINTSNTTLVALIQEAVLFAHNRGVLLVAAGGNSSGQGVYYPALFPEVLAVAALTINNTRPSYGPIGPALDIAAPGGDSTVPVLSLWPSDAVVRNKCPGAGRYLVVADGAWYCAEYGTSMAAPLVSGLAALVWSLDAAPTAAGVRGILLETARSVGLSADVQGAGLVDAEAAVRRTLPASLQVTNAVIGADVPPGSPPFVQTAVVENPSLTPLAVNGAIGGSGSWFEVTNLAGISFTASVQHGAPIYFTVDISPTYLVTGTYVGQVGMSQVTAAAAGAAQVDIFTSIGTFAERLGLAAIANQAGFQPTASQVPFTWETAISPTILSIPPDGSIQVTLPFAFPLPGPVMSTTHAYSVADVYADGFVTFPSSSSAPITTPGQNRCLPFLSPRAQGVFGWWADLDPSAPGAQIATFQPEADRFVVEYSNVASAAGVTPPYTVTFQIVLYQGGDVQFNYQAVPAPRATTLQAVTPSVTTGVQARTGLFHNEIGCITPAQKRGSWPAAGQSIHIKTGENY